jgi:sporulation protein YlmC with PRC-barrel domain
MLKLSGAFLGKDILSLRTGRAVAIITDAIINPDNLKIEGFYCTDTYDRSKLVLLYQDIRDLVAEGFIIDDHDVLCAPSDLVRLKTIMSIHYNPIGHVVKTVSKQAVGKVTDYATEIETLYIQKLYVAPRLLKSLTGGSLTVDRSQVCEITDKAIIIEDLLDGGTVPITSPA